MIYKILLVEDDPVIRGAIASHIRSWGYEAIEVEEFGQVMEIFTRMERSSGIIGYFFTFL